MVIAVVGSVSVVGLFVLAMNVKSCTSVPNCLCGHDSPSVISFVYFLSFFFF